MLLKCSDQLLLNLILWDGFQFKFKVNINDMLALPTLDLHFDQIVFTVYLIECDLNLP